MAENDETASPEPDRSSIDAWLNDVLAPSESASQPGDSARSETSHKSFLHQLAFRTDFRVPSGAELTGVEIREVPEAVYAADGEMISPGTWLFQCDHLDSVNFYADDITGLRHNTAVVGKFMLKRDEDQRSWSEIETSRLVLVENIMDAVKSVRAEDTSSTTPLESCVAHLIDIDVNIEADDPNAKTESQVRFSGMPPGAIMTSGDVDADGVWTIPQSLLNDLAIIVPAETPAFDLELTLITDGADDAVASMNIKLPEEPFTEDGSSLMLRFSPPVTKSPHFFRVFADGSEILNRVILWSGDPDVPVDLHIPLPKDEELPFELLVREDVLDHAKIQQAIILAAEFNDLPIRLDENLVRGNVTKTPTGLSWRGDLILLARDLPGQTVSVDHMPLPPIPETIDDTEPSFSNLSANDADTSLPSFPAPSSEDAARTLTINLSSTDIDQPGFIEELEALQNFLNSREDGDDKLVYDRLDLPVRTWRNLDVFGPTGARVDLDPALPRLAPTGGRDNKLQTIRLDNTLKPALDFDFIEVQGLPGACLLTHGRNLGNGRWRLVAEDAAKTEVVCLSSTGARIAKADAFSNDEDVPSQKLGEILVGGQSRRLQSSAPEHGVISVPLEADIFDPEGHGSLSLTVGDVPPGVLLKSGSNHGDGIWTYETHAKDYLAFQLMVPKRPFTVSITCVAMNEETGHSTVVTQRARVRPDRMEAILDHAVNA